MILLCKKYYHIRWSEGDGRRRKAMEKQERKKEGLGVLWKRKRKVKDGWGVRKKKDRMIKLLWLIVSIAI